MIYLIANEFKQTVNQAFSNNFKAYEILIGNKINEATNRNLFYLVTLNLLLI